MATADEVNVARLPASLGQNVARVWPDGLPTRDQLDNEEFTRQWFMTTTVNMNRRLNEVRSDTDGNSAAITTETTARTTADAALAQQITTVNATVGTVNARLTDEISARATADTALAGRVTTTETTVRGQTASITTLQQSTNGMAVQWGLVGNVGGQYGGLVFSGVRQLGGGATFLLEISSNVVINGNLLVTGTVNTLQLAPGAVSQVVTAASAGSSAAVAIVTRGGAIVVQAIYAGGSTTTSTNVNTPPIPGFGTFQATVDGALYVNQPNNSDTWYTYDNFSANSAGNVSYTSTVYNRQLQTSAVFALYPAAGAHTVIVTNTSAGLLFLIVTELAR
jgi:hypothetical protein